MSTFLVEYENVRAYLMAFKLEEVGKELGYKGAMDLMVNADKDIIGHILENYPQTIFKIWELSDVETLLDSSAVAKVNYVLKPQNRWIGYEFETKDDVYVEEADSEFSLFRLEKHGENVCIMVANWDEYCIHEDVTHLFDVDSILALCESQENLDDHTEYFLEYCEEEDGEY